MRRAMERAAAGSEEPAHSVLIVDDSRVQRRILTASLRRRGYRVLEAASGEEALAVCAAETVDFVVSDWMMQGMTGLAFCRAFRDLPRDSYGYFVLLTSKSASEEIARGLDAGADDFLTKPVNADELHARLRAGARILQMERALKDRNRQLALALEELQAVHDALDRDLVQAKRLQQSLVRERNRSFGTAEVSLLLRPSGHVGGDLVGFFPVNDDAVALYAIDVAGHGVTSALLTARIAGLLSGSDPDHNIALRRRPSGRYEVLPPAAVADRLNRLLLSEIETEHYLTLVLAEVDLVTGAVQFVQAGHPPPAIQRAGGRVEFCGTGGLPVGLLAEARYATQSVRLDPGDRLLLYTDGITEAQAPSGEELGEEGLVAFLRRAAGLGGSALLEALTREVAAHVGERDFADDVSAALLEFRAGRAFA